MEPELRAALLKTYLERLRSLGDDHAAAIRLDVDPAILRQVEGAPMSGWLPLALEVEILKAVERRRGEDGVRELGRVLGRVAVESPVFRSNRCTWRDSRSSLRANAASMRSAPSGDR